MCQITLTNIEYHLNEFKFSTGTPPFKANMGKCSDSQSVTYIPHVVHEITLGYIQINLLNVNSYVFVSMCIRKYAGNVQSP